MSVDKHQIKKVASTISKQEKIIEAAEERLNDQADELTIKGIAIDAQLESTQHIATTLKN